MRPRTRFLTLATPCRIAQVRVLRDSLRYHHPDASFDWSIPERQAGEPPHSLMSRCVAWKPKAIRRALEQTEQVVYLDPDTRLYARLDPLLEMLSRHPLVLTPHQIRPASGSRRGARDRNLVISGLCNGGVIGVRRTPETLHFLDWWHDRVRRDPVSRPADGLFYDQKWLDFALVWVPETGLLREPGINAGHWRLPEHQLTRHAAGWRIDGAPLRLFHFSGFDPEHSDRLSVYPDHVPADTPVSGAPADLLRDYARALRDAEPGHWERLYWQRPDLRAAFSRDTRRSRIRWWIWILRHGRRESPPRRSRP